MRPSGSLSSEAEIPVAIPWVNRVALGLVPGCTYYDKFGRNTVIPAGGADVWDGGPTIGATYPGQPEGTSSEPVTVTSTSTEDTNITGTGLWTLSIEGLNASGALDNETITMLGTTPAVSQKSWRVIFRSRGVTSGSARVSVGAITIRHQITTANVFSVMPVGFSRSQVAAFTVPVGHIALLLGGGGASLRTGGGGTVTREATFALKVRLAAAGSPWETLYPSGVSAYSELDRNFRAGASFPALTSLKASVLSATASSDCTARFEMILIDNNYLKTL